MKRISFSLVLAYLLNLSILGNNILITDMNREYDLPKNRVNCMFQDSVGFLWFGMVNGLYKFDLNSFAKYSIKDKNIGFPELDVRAIVEIKPELMLIGTNSGLFTFNSKLETYDTLNIKSIIRFSDILIQSICKSVDGSYWLGTDIGLMNIVLKNYENLEFELVRYFNNENSILNSSNVLEVKLSSSGVLWFLSAADLGFFNSSTQNITAFNAFGANTSIMFHEDDILLSSYGGGLQRFDTDSFTFYPTDINSLLLNAKVRYTYKDSHGKFWFSISNLGLLVVDSIKEDSEALLISNQRESFSSLNSNVIYRILETDDGAIWLCTEEGINMITVKPSFFKTQAFSSSKNPEFKLGVRALISVRQNMVYAGTIGEGLFEYNIEKNELSNLPLVVNDNAIGSTVQCLLKDGYGNVWIGTEGDGVIKLSQSERDKEIPEIMNIRAYPVPFPEKSLLNDYIMCLLEDDEKNIWIGTWYGLGLIPHSERMKKNPENIQIQNFLFDENNEYSLSNNIVKSILQDSKGVIWVGTDAGLNKIIVTDGEYKFQRTFINDKGEVLANKNILDLCEDRNGDLWFSTQEGGICLLHQESMRYEEFNAANGFHDNIINSIMQDSLGILWLGTNSGLCRFDPESYTFNMYSTEDQILSNDFFFRSSCKVGNLLVFGGDKGITYFNPYRISPSKIDPNLVITGFKLFNEPVIINSKKSPLKKSITYSDKLKLKYNQNYITLEFAALNYSHQKEIQYSCMLEGMENTWNNLRHDRKITYTNLNPGKYLFKVKSYTYGQHNNLAEVVLPITILPPLWRTTVAYIAYVLLIIFLIYYSYQYFLNKEKSRHELILERMNTKRLHEMDMLKLQFYTNVSHELRTPLTLISAPLESLMTNKVGKEKVESYYQLMHKNVQRLRRLINQLLDMRKIEEGHLQMDWARSDVIDFIQRVFANFEAFAEKREIKLSINCPDIAFHTFFDADKLEKVIFNLLSNAFKYTPDNGSIALDVEIHEDQEQYGFENGFYLMKISDTGFGIPKESIRNIYKPFHQVKKNKPIGSAGSGIGLSITKELIELHKGEISVDSEEGVGSTFIVKMPIILSIPEDAPSNVNQLDSGNFEDTRLEEETKKEIADNDSKEMVLVIEDDPDLRNFICGELQSKYSILEAANGDEGLKKAIDNIPDLIVSDIMMDEMDGLNLCKMIKEDIRTSHIPVILLTARHSEEVKQNSFEIGADEYITKPFVVKLLQSRIENLIRQRKDLRKVFSAEKDFDIKEAVTSTPDVKFIEKLDKLIEENIDNVDYSPSALASDMAMSRMQLYRKVSALTNQTVNTYIRSMRIKKAAQLLVSTDMQISEIAYSVGFSEASNFTKTFSKIYKQTPSQYAKEHRV